MWNHPSHASHIDNPDLVVSESAPGQAVSQRACIHGLASQGLSYEEQCKITGVQDLGGHVVSRTPTSPTYMRGYSDSGKCSSLYESGRTDSGFVSGPNILSSEQCLTEELSSRKLDETEEKETFGKSYMRIDSDSGVDLGLQENFSTLSLNDLNVPTKSHQESPLPYKNINLQSPYLLHPQNETQLRQPVTFQFSWQKYFIQDKEGDTQLHIAIIHGFIEVVYSLITNVPDPRYLDIPNDLCQTPLHMAVLTHQPQIVRRLLVAGASVDVRDRHGNTALHLACRSGDVECLNALLQPVSVAETRSASLQYAVMFPHVPLSLEERNYDGQMCVHLATVGDHIDVLRHLVWSGANLNVKEGKGGRTPLHLAVERRNKRMLLFLLEAGCRVSLELPTFAGYTAYQLASCVDADLAQVLLAAGASPLGLPDSDDDEDSDDEMFQNTENWYKGIEINGEPISA